MSKQQIKIGQRKWNCLCFLYSRHLCGKNLDLIWFGFIITGFIVVEIQALVKLKQDPHRSRREFLISIKIFRIVYKQTLHHFSLSALPIWNGLKAWSDGLDQQKQINRGDPGEILFCYPGIQLGNTPISLSVTYNAGFFFSFNRCSLLCGFSADPSGFLWCVTSQRQCAIFSSQGDLLLWLTFITTSPWHRVL